MRSRNGNMEWFIKNPILSNSTNAQHGVFCYAGDRTYPHRHIAIQPQCQQNEHNQTLEYTISFLSLLSNSSGLK
jgi:hypothetical protein